MKHGKLETKFESWKLNDKCRTKCVLLRSSKLLLKVSAPKYKEGDFQALPFRKLIAKFYLISGAPVVWYEISIR